MKRQSHPDRASHHASPSELDGEPGRPGDEFLRRVRRAAMHVLGDSPTGRDVIDLCDEHDQARRMILEDRSQGNTVVAVVGATGQGKSWLIRQMIRNSAAAATVRSGNNLDEATEKLVWVGPFPPADLDPRSEQFIHCISSDMQPIGMPYLLVDAPGSTDDRPAIAALARRALSMASVLLLMVRRDQLRSETVAVLTEASEGTVVIPIVNAVRRDDSLDTDVDAFVARMRKAAPTSRIVAPVMIEDFDVSGRGEVVVGVATAETVANRLQSEIGDAWDGDRRRSTRMAVRCTFPIFAPLDSRKSITRFDRGRSPAQQRGSSIATRSRGVVGGQRWFDASRHSVAFKIVFAQRYCGVLVPLPDPAGCLESDPRGVGPGSDVIVGITPLLGRRRLDNHSQFHGRSRRSPVHS